MEEGTLKVTSFQTSSKRDQIEPFSQVVPRGCVTDPDPSPNSLGKSYWKVTTMIEDILNYKNFKLHIENRMISD